MRHLIPLIRSLPRREALLLVVALSLIGLSGVTLSQAQDASPASTRDLELAWQRNWKNYARRCVKIRDAYYTCALFEPQYPSSRGVTTIALRQKTSKEVTERKGLNVTVKRNLVKPQEELDVGARSLPEVAVGHYGSIHSAEVLDILGPDEMVVAGIWIIDPKTLAAQRTSEREKLVSKGLATTDLSLVLEWMFELRDEALKKQGDRSFRVPVKVRGFSTAGLAKGDRWTGKGGDIQIAIVGEEVTPSTSKFRKPTAILLATPAEVFMKGIADEKEFIAFLESRKFTRMSFAQLVLDEKQLNPKDERLADSFIYAKLDGRGGKDEEKK